MIYYSQPFITSNHLIVKQIASYEVYGLDTTKNERSEAETLEDRGSLKAQKDDPVQYGHKYSWLVSLVNWGTSWTAPVDVHRVETSLTDNQVGAIQVQELDQRNSRDKVVVGDSLFANHLFLRVFLVVKNVFALVRLRSNSTFYEPPPSQPEGKKSAPPKHGAKLKLSTPSRPADRNETFMLGKQTVILQAWQ